MNRSLRAHPILMPLGLVAAGALLILLWWVAQPSPHAGHAVRNAFVFPLFMLGLGGSFILIGVLLAPVGIVLAVRRARQPLVLRCPSCGLEASRSARPFRVEDVPGVEYRMVRCPRCKWDFTIDKYAKLG